jgi:hypothetical protein
VAWRERAKLVAFVCAITGCGLVLASVSFQWTEIPLIPVAFLVFAESVRRVRSDEPAAQTVRTPLVFLLALGMFMPTLATDASSLAYTFFLKRIHGVANAQYAHVETPSMSNLYVDQSRNAAEFDDARDGIDLLRREVHSAEPVAAFGASNPFPYIMGWPSPKGGSIAMGYGRTVSDKSHPSPEFMYGAPNFVLKPISPPETESARWLERTYGPYVNEHFEAIAASTFWRLYRRKTTNK